MTIDLNSFRRYLDRGAVLNGYTAIGDPFVAEAYARQGFDVVTVDLQHGLADYGTALRILQALSGCDVVPMVRVPWLEPGLIMKLLDAGALGITCPMISTAEDARRLVNYTTYQPAGERSMGPMRAGLVYGPDYADNADGAIVRMAMIETREGVENVEEIAAVPGLTGLYIGPVDLSLALGQPRRADGFNAVVDEAVERILAACKANGIIAGTFASSPQRAFELKQRGFRFITMSNDISALRAQASSWVKTYRDLAAAADKA